MLPKDADVWLCSPDRTFSIFNFYGLFWIFYGFIDLFLILKMDFYRFLGTQDPIKNP